MKTKHLSAIIISIVVTLLVLTTGLTWARNNLSAPSEPLTALGSAFTYNGYLTDGGSPADGDYDFFFELFNFEIGGTSIMTTTLGDIAVEDGLFTVSLDFGNGAFDGDARWLEISVRPGIDTGAYTPLDDRQPVSPSPYALYAVEAGSVEWTDILTRPLGLDDGDDDTTYTAGFGLELDGTSLDVMTDTMQVRVTGGCAVGSTIRVVNADGSVLCQEDAPLNRNFSPSENISTTIDSTGDVGSYSSITIGSDGLPIISYFDNTNNNLKVAHCNDIACTTATISTVDSDVFVGMWSSITIGANGLPVISYKDTNINHLKIAFCSDLACESASFSPHQFITTSGNYTSIAIGADGFPAISFYRGADTSLRIGICYDAACTTGTQREVDAAGSVGRWTSIAVGADGFPIVSYLDETTASLKVAHCENLTCTSWNITIIDTFDWVGQYTSITIGTDWLPVISHMDNYGNLMVAHCEDIACTSVITNTIDTDGWVGEYTSITIGSDGLPIISYYDYTNGDLKVAHCSDLTCTSAITTSLDVGGDVGMWTAITIGVDGLPIISYYDNTLDDLKVFHCSNQLCVSYWRRR